MWPFSGAIDPLIRTEAVWIQTSCLMWIIKGFQHVRLPFDVFFSPLKSPTMSLLTPLPSPLKSQLFLRLFKLLICSDSPYSVSPQLKVCTVIRGRYLALHLCLTPPSWETKCRCQVEKNIILFIMCHLCGRFSGNAEVLWDISCMCCFHLLHNCKSGHCVTLKTGAFYWCACAQHETWPADAQTILWSHLICFSECETLLRKMRA